MKPHYKIIAQVLSLHWLLLLSSLLLAEEQETWDITNTGQPSKEVSFSVTEGTWMSVDVSPDGKTIVFDLLGDIYRMPASGGEATLLHGGPAMQKKPRFSPDGDRILYLSDASGNSNIWVSNVDGMNPRQITHETANDLTVPSWAPNGDYVLAGKLKTPWAQFSVAEIRLFHVDGGEGRLLIEASSVNEPQMSRDGQYLYYSEMMANGASYKNPLHGNISIMQRRLSDGHTEEILKGFGGAITPQPSPDGKRIAFIRRVKEKSVLFVYDRETGEQRPVYDQLDHDMMGSFYGSVSGSYYPQYNWFPDGKNLAIWGKGKLYKINMDTQDVQEIPFQVHAKHKITAPLRFKQDLAPEEIAVKAVRHVAYSPDGKTVLFHALGHLWQKQLPAGKSKRLTQTKDFEFEPAYSFDGKQIVYTSWDDERGSQLKIKNVQRRKVTTVLSSKGVIRQPAFSRDGKQVVYWVEGGNTNTAGYRTKPGFYRHNLTTGKTHYLGNAGTKPQFSIDGQRIYYLTPLGKLWGAGRTLKSINLDGENRQEHAIAKEATELSISPDQQWLSFKENHRYFIVPYREMGIAISLGTSSKAVPVIALSKKVGYELQWSSDAKRVYWSLGNTLYSASAESGFTDGAKLSAIDLTAKTDKPEGLIAFVHGRIITMENENVIEQGTVLVKDNRIVAVGASDQITIPKQAKIIDVSGKTLMPGLIDGHGHPRQKSGISPQKHLAHYAAAAYGITATFDPATADLQAYARTEMNLTGVSLGLRLMNSGKPLQGYTGVSNFTDINSLDDAREAVGAKKAMGGAFIKSYWQSSRTNRQYIIKAAREANMMVAAEGGRQYYNAITFVLDGHTTVEHGIRLANYYDDLLQLVAHSGTALTPTMYDFANDFPGEKYFYQTTRPWDDPKVKRYNHSTSGFTGTPSPPYVRGMITDHIADEILDADFRATGRSLKRLDDAGGTVNAGSHGQLYGLDLHWTMWSLAEGGMSPQRVLNAATMNVAKTLGVDDQIGSLKVGKLADLIILDKNPLDDIRNTNSVRYTMINGRLYDSLSMNEIGNYDRPRSQFYWELEDYKGIDWNESWSSEQEVF